MPSFLSLVFFYLFFFSRRCFHGRFLILLARRRKSFRGPNNKATTWTATKGSPFLCLFLLFFTTGDQYGVKSSTFPQFTFYFVENSDFLSSSFFFLFRILEPFQLPPPLIRRVDIFLSNFSGTSAIAERICGQPSSGILRSFFF